MNGVGNNVSNGRSVHKEFYQPEYLLNTELEYALPYAVMVLNRPVNFPVEYILPFWNKAAVRITVDGGTNRWYSYLEKNNVDSSSVAKVDIVCGDFDSITDEVLREVKLDSSIKVVHTPDQDDTDFTKAIKLLAKYSQERNIHLDCLIVVCQSSGRMDQIMGNVNTLYKYNIGEWMDTTLYILSDDSISWLLNKGTSKIQIPDAMLQSKNTWCALMPIGSKATVTSTGLRWNLDNTTMEFGGLVSTSNKFGSSQIVTVTTDAYLVWSMNIIPLFSKLYGIPDEECS